MDHVITIETYQRLLEVSCSCGVTVAMCPSGITLDELSALAHEHIENADIWQPISDPAS